MTEHFETLDRISARARAVALEPGFSGEVASRMRRTPSAPLSDSACLQRLAALIAYSQGARSAGVDAMINAGHLERALGSFELDRVANLDASDVLAAHWDQLGAMRFRKKVVNIIRAARAMKRLRASGAGLPSRLASFPSRMQEASDVDVFWRSFDALRLELKAAEMPYFVQLTSLLHLLLDRGFGCIKPDSVVQDVAISSGLMRASPRERDLRALVGVVQAYAVARGLHPSVVDFYLLADGRQTWALQFIRTEFRARAS